MRQTACHAVNPITVDSHVFLFIMPPTSKKLREPIGFGLSIRPSVRLVWFLFYGPSTHFRSFRARSVNLATLFLGKPPRQFYQYLVHILSPVTDNCYSWISGRGRMAVEMFSWPVSTKECAGRGPSVRASVRQKPVNARVLKFHIWISHGKIADTHFFSLPELSPFLELCPFEKSEWNLVSKISRKVFELGAWNLVSWSRGLKLGQLMVSW